MLNLVIFDIDGTLTQTNLIDTEAYVEALATDFGICAIDTEWENYRHSTDSGILQEVFLKHCSRAPVEEETARFQERFVVLVTGALEAADDRELPTKGSRALIDYLSATRGWALALASGCWKASAEAKLARAGFKIHGWPAAYADDAIEREEILALAIERARRLHGCREFDRIVYVGDELWDLRAAQKLGLLFIGIAEGAHARRLRSAGAEVIVRDFIDIRHFMNAL
jgi:phosphoglycolate phosphatase-like HAD superfamily hydrolase